MKKYVRCEFGHYYDPSKYESCPHCFARSAGLGEELTVAKSPIDEKVDKAYGLNDADAEEPIQAPARRRAPDVRPAYAEPAAPVERTAPVRAEEPVRKPVAPVQDEMFYAPAEPAPQDEDPITVAKLEQQTGVNPPVGWLVEIAGPNKGKTFEIHAERNTLGRSSAMDICLKGDVGISRDTNGVVSYNPRNRDFHIIPGEGKAIIYLNGRELMGPEELRPYDRVEISDTALVFVPLCGEQFCWEEV